MEGFVLVVEDYWLKLTTWLKETRTVFIYYVLYILPWWHKPLCRIPTSTHTVPLYWQWWVGGLHQALRFLNKHPTIVCRMSFYDAYRNTHTPGCPVVPPVQDGEGDKGWDCLILGQEGLYVQLMTWTLCKLWKCAQVLFFPDLFCFYLHNSQLTVCFLFEESLYSTLHQYKNERSDHQIDI